MNGKNCLKQRSKGLLAILMGVVMLTIYMQNPLIVNAVSANTVTVSAGAGSVIVGNGDIIVFEDGVYGHIDVSSDGYATNTVFPAGETGVRVMYSGSLYEKYCDTGTAYTVSGAEGLYRAANVTYSDRIVWYSYDDITSNGSSVVPDTGGGDFVYMCLVAVPGCKVDYVNDVTGNVLRTDYVIYGETSAMVWEPGSTELAKEGYTMQGWSAASGSETVQYGYGEILNEELYDSTDVSEGVLTLYPVWEAVETPTETPSEEPTETPSEEPSETPSEEEPTETPSEEEPTETPSEEPSETPSEEPSETPSEEPSEIPPVPSEVPTTPALPASKSSGSVTVNMDNYRYGESVPSIQISSSTNDVSKATVTYKPVGAADSAYTNQAPSAVGNYMVKVVLPETATHTQAVATDTFTISYLRTPTPAYQLNGRVGNSGWYTSDVTITPPVGYEMSVGNRDAFSTEGYVVEKETNHLRIYLRQTSTGAMTDGVTIANLRVDADAPELADMEDGGEYYEDAVKVYVAEENLKTVKLDGKIVQVVAEEDGSNSFVVETGIRRLSHTIEVMDEAGNSAKISVITGPAWLKDGIIGEGEYYLETGEEYHMPEGSNWSIDGDNTVYAGGCDFYANKEGEVTFCKE